MAIFPGLGWQLEGFSAIERCPKTFATEGLADGVHGDTRDAFCLDGHKLIAIQGVYGDNGTEYRTEDDIFARIVAPSVTAGQSRPTRRRRRAHPGAGAVPLRGAATRGPTAGLVACASRPTRMPLRARR
jgi:hypothetical protein